MVYIAGNNGLSAAKVLKDSVAKFDMGSNHETSPSSPVGLLTSKLYLPPARADLVLRPRLISQLNNGLKRKLTIISAPAGFGKTTLLGEWIPASPRCFTWVALNHDDNDAMRLR